MKTKLSVFSAEIIRRWFEALDVLIEKEQVKNLFTFTKEHGLTRQMVERLREDPTRKFEPYYFQILVEDYGVSAHWLITGKGGMGI